MNMGLFFFYLVNKEKTAKLSARYDKGMIFILDFYLNDKEEWKINSYKVLIL